MSFSDSLEQIERRANLQGILMILAIALILFSFLQIFPLEVYPSRLLLLLTGTILLALDLYFIITEEKTLIKQGIAPERIPKKPRMLQSADILATSLLASSYAVFVICFFLIGLFYSSISWASLLIFPSVVSFFYGYFVGNLKKVIMIIFAGCLIGMVVALALYAVPFLEAYRSSFVDIAESIAMGPLTEEEILGVAILTIMSYISLQLPFGFFAAYAGSHVKNKE
jgi:hypothetical protein